MMTIFTRNKSKQKVVSFDQNSLQIHTDWHIIMAMLKLRQFWVSVMDLALALKGISHC